MAESSNLKRWRRKQKRGAIMKPSTFKDIEHKAEERGLSPERAKKVAGKAYWRTAEAKHRKSKTRKKPRKRSRR